MTHPHPLHDVLRRMLADEEGRLSLFSLDGAELTIDGTVTLTTHELAAVREAMTGSPLPAVEYSLTQTCAACPTQYDVELEDGRYAYFRYRHGAVSLELYTSEDAMGGEPLAAWGERLGDDLDGVMEHERVVALVAEHLPRLVQEAAA